MKLISKLRKQQTGQIGVETNTPAETLFGDLTPLTNLVTPMRKRMAEYDHAIHALAVARERLRDLADVPPPDMTLTVKREIVVAMGDPDELARFDIEHGEEIKAQRVAREAAQRDREELPARILALEQIVRQIAKKMIDGESVFDIEKAAFSVFEPYAQRLFEAAKIYASVMQEAATAAQIIKESTLAYEYDLYGDLKRTHRPEFMGDIEEGILPQTMARVSFEAIQEVNRQFVSLNHELAIRMEKELVDADLNGETLRIYCPGAADDHRKISAPELTQRIRRPQPIPYGAATIVTVGV